MRMALGVDHAGLPLKWPVRDAVLEPGHEILDPGTRDSHPTDYPDVACAVAQVVFGCEASRCILICGSGIAANKVPGISAGLAHDTYLDTTPSATEVLNTVASGDYIAILAYVPRNEATNERLQRARLRLRDRHRVATTVGFGPRFLPSTGQLRKDGPNSCVFLQIAGAVDLEIEIPGKQFTFGQLKAAQALSDLESLRSKGRRVARVTLEELERMTK